MLSAAVERRAGNACSHDRAPYSFPAHSMPLPRQTSCSAPWRHARAGHARVRNRAQVQLGHRLLRLGHPVCRRARRAHAAHPPLSESRARRRRAHVAAAPPNAGGGAGRPARRRHPRTAAAGRDARAREWAAAAAVTRPAQRRLRARMLAGAQRLCWTGRRHGAAASREQATSRAVAKLRVPRWACAAAAAAAHERRCGRGWRQLRQPARGEDALGGLPAPVAALVAGGRGGRLPARVRRWRAGPWSAGAARRPARAWSRHGSGSSGATPVLPRLWREVRACRRGGACGRAHGGSRGRRVLRQALRACRRGGACGRAHGGRRERRVLRQALRACRRSGACGRACSGRHERRVLRQALRPARAVRMLRAARAARVLPAARAARMLPAARASKRLGRRLRPAGTSARRGRRLQRGGLRCRSRGLRGRRGQGAGRDCAGLTAARAVPPSLGSAPGARALLSKGGRA
jgi:hypothetical protein